MYTAYAIYKNGVLSKLVIFNFMTEPTGASDSYVTISVGGGALGLPNDTPTQVRVKYLIARSVSEKTNITWAGQGFEAASDGILKGNENVVTVPCDQTSNACQVHIPAPGFALVFITDDSGILSEDPAHTYSTTAYTKTWNTIKADLSVLATSNGHSGKDRQFMGSTSFESKTGASVTHDAAVSVIKAVVLGVGILALFVGLYCDTVGLFLF